MLVTRWNKNGKKVTCESGQLKVMAENGYKLKECPEVKVKPKTKPKVKPKAKPPVKPKAKIEEKVEKSTPDIVLE